MCLLGSLACAQESMAAHEGRGTRLLQMALEAVRDGRSRGKVAGEIRRPRPHQGRVHMKLLKFKLQAPSEASFKFRVHNFVIFLLQSPLAKLFKLLAPPNLDLPPVNSNYFLVSASNSQHFSKIHLF